MMNLGTEIARRALECPSCRETIKRLIKSYNSKDKEADCHVGSPLSVVTKSDRLKCRKDPTICPIGDPMTEGKGGRYK